jgi:ubiquinol-cytochrome c reductase cytochrome b subunit
VGERRPGLKAAFEDRTGAAGLLRRFLDEPIPGGARWGFVFGSVVLVGLLLLAATGVAMALYYSPSTTSAWASVHHFQTEVTLGWLIRGLHRFGAHAVVIALGLHLAQVLLAGAYRAPREVTWWTGLLLFGLVMAFAITGFLLPWDQEGYWATRVTAGVMGLAPGIGDGLASVALGGTEIGNLTLTRFYALHVVLLPAATLALLTAHLYLFRRHGPTTPPEAKARPPEAFWPGQMFRDAVAACILLAVVAAVTIVSGGATLHAPADPQASWLARPDWYFRGLFQLLKYFPGHLEVVGALVLPGLIAGWLFALPLFDRAPGATLRRRWPYLLPVGVAALGYALLVVLSYRDDAADPAIRARLESQRQADARALVLAAGGVPVDGAGALMARDPLIQGRSVLERHCTETCHAFGGPRPDPETAAPDLGGYMTRAWLSDFLRDPASDRFYGGTAVDGMDPVEVEGEAFEALVDFLMALRDHPGVPEPEWPESLRAAAEASYYEHACDDCHSLSPDEGGFGGPSLNGLGSVWRNRKLVAHSGRGLFFGGMAEMPRFDERLQEAELDAVARYLTSLSMGEAVLARD